MNKDVISLLKTNRDIIFHLNWPGSQSLARLRIK